MESVLYAILGYMAYLIVREIRAAREQPSKPIQKPRARILRWPNLR